MVSMVTLLMVPLVTARNAHVRVHEQQREYALWPERGGGGGGGGVGG